jgi:acetylornithine deacetylase/succinyl-diaminopimelate desuccinylase-like protein
LKTAAALLLLAGSAFAADEKLAKDIFRQLVEINTTDSAGSVTRAAEAMKQRFLDAGFPSEDLTIVGPEPRKGNLVARLHAANGVAVKPVLIICHLDVVEARREDWTTDPFQFIEKDGYFYGRGTQDMKANDAVLVATLIRFKQEGFVPNRDIVLALTAGEESGVANGVDWLLKNRRDLVDAEFVLNPDGGGVTTERGKPVNVDLEASEKIYADFALTVRNKGGHSSLPVPDNAIYHIADALGKLERSPFPFELNNVTRAYFEQMAKLEKGQRGEDMRAILRTTPDPAAIARLSADPRFNSMMRTTCVATRLNAGHANNALPQSAEAVVNCRILPGHSPEEIQRELARIFADPQVKIERVDPVPTKKPMAPAPLRPDVFKALKRVSDEMWPGAPVIPEMETGASDSVYTMAAISRATEFRDSPSIATMCARTARTNACASPRSTTLSIFTTVFSKRSAPPNNHTCHAPRRRVV